MPDRENIPGKFIWFELASRDLERAKAFYAEALGWKAVRFPFGGTTYEMIFAGETPDTMIGSYVPAQAGAPSRFLANVSVRDVDAAAASAVKLGGKVVAPPRDLSGVGRTATVRDPSGAEIALFKSATGDPPDVAEIPFGRFMWNDLHTPNTDQALAFYTEVVGFSHKSVSSPAGPYHVLSSAGKDRAGITSHLSPGASPHWLPFVRVADVDATAGRARRLGATIQIEPKDIMDIGRLAVLEDPTGAALALMTPRPRTSAAP